MEGIVAESGLKEGCGPWFVVADSRDGGGSRAYPPDKNLAM